MSNDGLRRQIYNNLNLKETDELLDIWQINNRGEWSDDAFEIIKSILKERGAEILEQNEPVYEAEKDREKIEEDDDLEEWEAKLLDDENQPEFYDTLDVLNIRSNIDKVANAAIIVYGLLSILNLQFVSFLLRGIPISFSKMLQLLPYEIFTILTTGLQIVITYFSLKALAHILRILMEMEFRSRKV